MDNKRIYTIQINGISESIDGITALNKQLDALSARIKALEKSNVKVSAASSGGSSKSMDEEAKLAKQIEQIDEKRKAYSKEIYQNYLAAKDVLKETVKDQQQIAASERLQASNYGNTMAGLKQELADIKSVMQTTDLGDSKFQEMTKRAGELTQKLKELEQNYGQFGRNVGNYASAVEGLNKYRIEVGGVAREFSTAKEAAKTLSNELLNLPKGAEGAKELREALQQVKSEMKDIGTSSVVMDNLLDTMEGIVAVANLGQGIRGLFGVDDAEIQKSIKNLVALQNVLKGIETINKQINTREGIGAWIAPFTTQIDKATAKLLTFNTALLGTGKASKVAAIGIKTFSKALKVAFSGGILIVVDLLVEKLMDLVESFKKVDKAAENSRKVQEAGAKAYAEGAAKIALYKQRVESFNGTKKQEKKLVEEFNKELGEGLGTYKSISEVQKALIEKSDAYCEALRMEAEAQALLNLYTEAYVNLQKVKMANAAGENDSWWRTRAGNEAHRTEVENAAKKDADTYWEAYVTQMKKAEQHKKDNKLYDNSPQIDKGGKKTEDTVKKVEESISKARIDAMKNGFAKTMAQLELERNKRIEEARKTGYKVAEQVALANKIYHQQVLEATITYHTKLIEEQKKFNDEWEKLNQTAYARNVETSKGVNTYNLNQKKNKYSNNPVDSAGNELDANEWINQYTYNYNNIIKYNQKLIESYKRLKAEVDLANLAIEEIENGDNNIGSLEDWQKKLDENEHKLYQFIEKYPGIARAAEDAVTTDLSTAYTTRTMARQAYYENILKYAKEYADEEIKIEKDKLSTEQYNLEQAEKKRHQTMVSSIFDDDKSKENVGARLKQLYEGYAKEYNSGILGGKTTKEIATYFSEYRKEVDKWLDELQEKTKKGEVAWEDYIEITNSKLIKGYIDLRADAGDNMDMLNEGFVKFFDNMRHEFQAHTNEMLSIEGSYNQKMKDAEEQRNKDIKAANAEYYSSMESEIEEVLSSINSLIETSQQRNGLGLINMKATKKNLDNLKDTTRSALDDIETMKNQMLEKLKSGEMEFPDFDPIYEQLRTLELQLLDASRNIKKKTSEIFTDFMSEISNYASQLGSALNSLVSAIGDYTDQQYENEINQLEDYIDEYEELLDKQRDIVEKHKSEIDNIEDELANSRGDRRQHLIDQLNAEMEARRAAAAEEKRLEKEKKALEAKKEKEEKNRLEAQKRIQTTQAVINGAVAFMNALATQPIWLGIAMAALTASMTAVQLATINSAKYAKGGLLEGPSHKQGGIKVPGIGNGIELEGNEFVVRKKTSLQNIDLLDYINKSERKLDLSDFIDFYGGKVKKNIASMSPGRKYADGGALPTIRNDYNFDDRLLNAFEDYSNRPVVVSVVDINNKQDDVRRVQTLAGL